MLLTNDPKALEYIGKKTSDLAFCCTCAEPDYYETDFFPHKNKPLIKRKIQPFRWTEDIIRNHTRVDRMKKPYYIPE